MSEQTAVEDITGNVIAKDDESLRRAWELLGGEPDSLDMSECRQLAAFEYKATK